MRIRYEKVIFTLYLIGFIVMSLSMAFSQPISDTPPVYANPPDEHARYLIPKYICEHGKIPTGLEEEVRIPGYGFSYGLYNVFPYIMQGYTMRFISMFTDSEIVLLYSARIVNVLLGTCMAMIVYLIAERLFTDNRFKWLYCFGVMYLPQNLFVHTYVNTDSCCLLSITMIMYGVIKCYQDDINYNNALWMSGGIILCALSYYNAYGYILSCILLFFSYFMKRENGQMHYDWKGMVKWGILISIVVFLGIGWWFVRSYIVLDGDILGLKTRNELAKMYAVEKVNPLKMSTYQSKGYSISEMFKENRTFEGVFTSFVAAYGSMSICGNIWLYRGYKLLWSVGAMGSIISLISNRCKYTFKQIFFHINMFFCILMPFFLMIYYSYTIDYQHQGRYLLPALVPFMYYMVKGVEKVLFLCIKTFGVSVKIIDVAVNLILAGIVIGLIHMIYFCAMPTYMKTGVV